MMRQADELAKLLEEFLKQPENEYIEFKKAKDSFDTDKLGKYFSAIRNEATLKNIQYGWIIFGIDDKTHELVGTNYCSNNNFNLIKKQISDNTLDHSTFVEIYSLDIESKRIIMRKGIAYGRSGESLTLLSNSKQEHIKANFKF